jgi:protein tyrosine phosphatase (PTP) superfamily phosphohydrolase (DUF442 family)
MPGGIPSVSQLLAAISGVPNACEPVPGLVTGGQPTVQHLAALKAAGCESVLDGRDLMEARPFPDEAEVVRAAQLEYVNLALSYTPPDDVPLARLRELLAPVARGRRTLLHCNSGNRIGAALIPYLMLDRGMAEDDAVALAMRIGARDPGLIEWALNYVRKARA